MNLVDSPRSNVRKPGDILSRGAKGSNMLFHFTKTTQAQLRCRLQVSGGDETSGAGNFFPLHIREDQ